jgi:hypothetical protein
MITNGRTDMILGTNNNADVLQYNKDYNQAVAAIRMNQFFGGAKNKKKPNRRTKRHRRRKASRRNASRRNMIQ